MKISAIIITKNEEQMIEECIRSLSFCDEVLVIDSGSTDNTLSLAKRLDATVYSLDTDDFSKRRDYGKEKAKSDWVLYVDADERVSKELREEIQNIVVTQDTKAAYRLRRTNVYYNYYTWPQVEKLERLFKKSKLIKWYGKLHETAVVDGEIGELSHTLFHYTRRSIAMMVKKTIEWSKTEAQLRYQANHPKMTWWRFPRVMVTGFLKAYVKEGGYTMGTAGIVESFYQAYSLVITYARLWEMQQQKHTK